MRVSKDLLVCVLVAGAVLPAVLNRGHQDLILITQSAPLLFRNDGHGKFTLVRDAFPPNPQQASLTSAAMADYDNDGYLDLYVCSYGYFQGQGTTPIPTPYYDARNGPPNYLYRNRGDGTFEDVTRQSGLDHGNDRFSFACVWADIEDDGWPDLCVVNDFGRNNLYRNRHDGTFEEIIDGLPGYGAGMSAAFAAAEFPGAAEIYLALLVENNPGDAEAQYNLALSRRETGQPDLALSGVRAALTARPVFPEAENLLAVLLMDSGRLAEARAQLDKATHEAPDLAEAWNNLGYARLRRPRTGARAGPGIPGCPEQSWHRHGSPGRSGKSRGALPSRPRNPAAERAGSQ